MFQSAPLTEARGDAYTWRSFSDRTSFNPLPSQKQGETLAGRQAAVSDSSFNPLPSQKQGETLRAAPRPAPVRSFNPLPSQKQGETNLHSRLCAAQEGFNPLPSQKQGETTHNHSKNNTLCVSIRSPHRSKGRLVGCCCPYARGAVSIRSPHRSKGRHMLEGVDLSADFVSIRSPHRSKGRPADGDGCNRAIVFQSAPLTEARGDVRWP